MLKRIILPILFLLVATLCFAQDFVVITNSSSPIDSASSADLKNVFLGKKTTWDDGSAIIPAVLKSGDVKETFLKTVVKKSSKQFAMFWKKAIFTGTGTPPQEFENEAALIAYIKSTPGAIGFVSSGAETSEVKVISIN